MGENPIEGRLESWACLRNADKPKAFYLGMGLANLITVLAWPSAWIDLLGAMP